MYTSLYSFITIQSGRKGVKNVAQNHYKFIGFIEEFCGKEGAVGTQGDSL